MSHYGSVPTVICLTTSDIYHYVGICLSPYAIAVWMMLGAYQYYCVDGELNRNRATVFSRGLWLCQVLHSKDVPLIMMRDIITGT